MAWDLSAKMLTSHILEGYKWMIAAQNEKKCPDWRRITDTSKITQFCSPKCKGRELISSKSKLKFNRSSVSIVEILDIEIRLLVWPYHALNMADSAFSHAIIKKGPMNLTDSVWV